MLLYQDYMIERAKLDAAVRAVRHARRGRARRGDGAGDDGPRTAPAKDLRAGQPRLQLPTVQRGARIDSIQFRSPSLLFACLAAYDVASVHFSFCICICICTCYVVWGVGIYTCN